MKKLILLVLVMGLSLSSYAADRKYPVSEIPEELLQETNAVVRLDENKFVVKSPGKASYTEKWVCTILNSKADKYTTFGRSYNNLLKITSLKGFLYDANGKLVKKLKGSEIIDQSNISGFSLYEDSRVKIATLSHSAYPYTIEFICEFEYEGLFAYPSWYPQSSRKLAVQKSTLEVVMPRNMSLRYNEKNVNPVDIKEDAESKRYYWQEESLNTYDYEPMSNPLAYKKRVMLAPVKFSVEGVEGDMSDWEKYGEFYATLNKGTRDLSTSTKEKIISMTKDLKTEKEKIAKVYQYLQEKTRYVSIQVGIGGIKPFPASLVDEKGYGDCKALSNYTKAMLEAIGINSYYTLVGADDDFTPVSRDFTSDYFNHVILCVPLEQDTVWLECTSQTQAMGYMSDFTGDRDVFVITPEGGKIWRTPAYKKEVNYTKRHVKVKVDEKGNAKINTNTIFSTLQEGRRAFLVNNSKEEQKKWLYEQIELSNFTITDFSMERHKSEFPYVEEKLEIDDPSFARVSGKRIFIEPNIFSKWEYVPRKDEERVRPVYLSNSYDFIDTDTVEFELPENYHVEYKPEPVSLESKFGKYQMSIEIEHNKIKYIRKVEMNPGTYPKESYEDLRNFYKEINKFDKTKIVMVNNT